MSKITLSYSFEYMEESVVVSFSGGVHLEELLARCRQFIIAVGYPVSFSDRLQLVAEDEIVIKADDSAKSDFDDCLCMPNTCTVCSSDSDDGGSLNCLCIPDSCLICRPDLYDSHESREEIKSKPNVTEEEEGIRTGFSSGEVSLDHDYSSLEDYLRIYKQKGDINE